MTTSRKSHALLFAVLAPLLGLGCGDDDASASPDAGGQAGQGGSAPPPDAGAAQDSGTDGGTPDASRPVDGGDEVDGGDDDGGHDPDAGGGMADLWAGCPDGDDFAGTENGPHTLVATQAGVYCAMFQETRTLKEELAAKAMLRVAPGTYGLPGADATSFALPLCIRLASAPQPLLQAPGSVTYSSFAGSGNTTHSYTWRQPFALGAGTQTLDTRLEIVAATGVTPSLTLDGENVPAFDEASRASFMLCEDPDSCFPALIFDSCTFENAAVQVHDVSLGSDGEVALELHIGDSFASTEPGAFVRATGTFRGRSFDQQDYWKLVYSPDHHHFARDFAVLFDAPIDGVCGLEVDRLEPFPDGTELDEAHAIDCELDRIETLSVTGHVFDDGA